MKRPAPRSLGLYLLLSITALIVLSATAGCNVIGFIAGMGESRKQEVKAAYTDLEDQRIAVMVIADDSTAARHREAMSKLRRWIAARIAGQVPNVTLSDPEQLERFEDENPYWTSLPHGDLPERLGVDRVVLVDIHRYGLRSPEARDMWLGRFDARVGVIEAEARIGRDFVYESEVSVRFPEDSPYGVADATQRSIEHGLIESASRAVARLFYDHTVESGR